MIAMGIMIDWNRATEYIELDLDNLNKLEEVVSTREWWSDTREFVRYNTQSTIKHLSRGGVELTLQYNREANTHIDPEDACWGHSIIKLLPGASSGEAAWRDYDTADHDGSTTWTRIACALTTEKKREVVSRVQREQDKLRKALLTYEKWCALTGEETVESLEAAHVIPVKERGADIVQNAMLLRADLHRLYDAGKFVIDTSGDVAGLKDVSDAYRTLLRKARLSAETYQRVQLALRQRLRA